MAKWKVSESWVAPDNLTIEWSAGIDRNRHQANPEERYKLCFDMLYSKIREYDNMDEKGFFVGIATRSKRISIKAIWLPKSVQQRHKMAIENR